MKTMEEIQKLIHIAEMRKLNGIDILKQFTQKELCSIYNGIGPDRFPDWLLDIVTGAVGLFEPAALIHDVEYHVGGDYAAFTEANERFRQNCYALVKATYGWYNPMRYAWLNKARRFANYCQLFGWQGYHQIKTKGA